MRGLVAGKGEVFDEDALFFCPSDKLFFLPAAFFRNALFVPYHKVLKVSPHFDREVFKGDAFLFRPDDELFVPLPASLRNAFADSLLIMLIFGNYIAK